MCTKWYLTEIVVCSHGEVLFPGPLYKITEDKANCSTMSLHLHEPVNCRSLKKNQMFMLADLRLIELTAVLRFQTADAVNSFSADENKIVQSNLNHVTIMYVITLTSQCSLGLRCYFNPFQMWTLCQPSFWAKNTYRFKKEHRYSKSM